MKKQLPCCNIIQNNRSDKLNDQGCPSYSFVSMLSCESGGRFVRHACRKKRKCDKSGKLLALLLRLLPRPVHAKLPRGQTYTPPFIPVWGWIFRAKGAPKRVEGVER